MWIFPGGVAVLCQGPIPSTLPLSYILPLSSPPPPLTPETPGLTGDAPGKFFPPPAPLLRFIFQWFSCEDRTHVASGSSGVDSHTRRLAPRVSSFLGDTHSQLHQASHAQWPGLPVGTWPVVLTLPGPHPLGWAWGSAITALDFLAISHKELLHFHFSRVSHVLFLSGRQAVWGPCVGCGLAWPSEAWQ